MVLRPNNQQVPAKSATPTTQILKIAGVSPILGTAQTGSGTRLYRQWYSHSIRSQEVESSEPGTRAMEIVVEA